MQAVIICGGKGKRISRYIKNTPKGLIKIGKKTNIEHQISLLKKNGINNFLFLTNNYHKTIKKFIEKKKLKKCRIHKDNFYSGPGGALFGAKNFLDKKFVVLLSDVFISMNIKKFISYSLNKKTDCTIVSHSNSHPKDSDTVEFDKRGKVSSIIFKNSKKNKINSSMAGIYFFKKKFLNNLKFKKNHSYDLVKNIIGKSFKNNIFSYHTIEYIKDFGTIERLKKVRNDVKLKLHKKNIYNKKKPAVFLDRDGVINREIGPIRNPKNLKLLKNSSKAIKLLNERQIPCFLITNQSIISKRKITINNFKSLIAKLDNELSKVNAYIDDLRICPNSDKKKINVRKHYFLSKYKKPNPGMLFEIKKKHNIDLKKSFYVGDTDIDMLTSYNAKCRKILLLNEKKMKKYKYNVLPDWIVLNLQTAVKKIILKKIK